MTKAQPPANFEAGLGRWLVLALPYAWLVLFFLAPFALILKVSLSEPELSQPPYAPVFDSWDASVIVDKLRSLSLGAYARLIEDALYLRSYLESAAMAGAATFATLLIGYPLALAIARSPARWRLLLLTLAIAPLWTSSLVRVYAWILILKDEGVLNHALIALGLVTEPLHIFATNWAVLIGIVYAYLPFMALPLYAAIENQDRQLAEAAADLGAGAGGIFWRITLPLSLPGVYAGALMVFIPAVGEFVIPDLLGGSDTLMIGTTLWNDFFVNRDWPAAAAAAVALLALLLGPLLFYERMQMQAGANRR
ncbi:ABC transporter permease [Methylocapsa aurea]|uniref:ABC transporter permease n=1 Tax=Methylocapsa aurea TaxID=663610 RepID=UPI0005666D48|nr:ABC transporter permease subunit [Methylocapsa aurea]